MRGRGDLSLSGRDTEVHRRASMRSSGVVGAWLLAGVDTQLGAASSRPTSLPELGGVVARASRGAAQGGVMRAELAATRGASSRAMSRERAVLVRHQARFVCLSAFCSRLAAHMTCDASRGAGRRPGAEALIAALGRAFVSSLTAAAGHQREMQPTVGQLVAKPRSLYLHATTDSPR